MFKNRWKTQFTIILLFISIVLYVIHFFLFHEPRFIFKLMINNLAFAPISVLFVTLFINQVLEIRTKRERAQKNYLALGTFFHEIGGELIRRMASFDSNIEETRELVSIDDSWGEKEFLSARKELSGRHAHLSPERMDIIKLGRCMIRHKKYIVDMLSNPILMEHEALTDMLWSTYHLAMEFSARKDINTISESDMEHLTSDAERAYGFLCIEWLEYMKHLKKEYPYLYSFAMRTHPFRGDDKTYIQC